MTRRQFSGRTADHMAGRLASFAGTCPRCDRPIVPMQSQVVLRKHEWVHTACTSGADE